MKILLRNCDPSKNVNFLQETQEQEPQDQNDLGDSLLAPERKKEQGNLFLHNFLLLVQLFLVIKFAKYNTLLEDKVYLQTFCGYFVGLFVPCLSVGSSAFQHLTILSSTKQKKGVKINREL